MEQATGQQVVVPVVVVPPDPLLQNWPSPPDFSQYPRWLRRMIWNRPYHTKEWIQIGFNCHRKRQLEVHV